MGGFLCPLPVCAPCAAGLRACSIFNFFAFAFSCLTFASQNSFHLSLMPRRAPHFLLRKENGGKEPRGERRAAPLRTPFLRPAADPPFSRAAGRLSAALWAAIRRLTGKRPKSQGAELSFSSVSVRWGCAGAFAQPGKTEARRWACTRKKPRACETRGRKRHGARLARRSRASCPPQVCPPQARAFSLPGKTGAQRGPTLGKNRVRARRGEEKDTVRDLPTAGAAGSPCIRAGEYGMLRARQNRQSSRNSLRGRADAPVPWEGPGDICARPCVCR